MTDQRHNDNLSEEERSRIGEEGGNATKEKYGPGFYSEIGSKGGAEAQHKGTAHQLTKDEQSEGGSKSSGNFKNNPERASEVAKDR